MPKSLLGWRVTDCDCCSWLAEGWGLCVLTGGGQQGGRPKGVWLCEGSRENGGGAGYVRGWGKIGVGQQQQGRS